MDSARGRWTSDESLGALKMKGVGSCNRVGLCAVDLE